MNVGIAILSLHQSRNDIKNGKLSEAIRKVEELMPHVKEKSINNEWILACLKYKLFANEKNLGLTSDETKLNQAINAFLIIIDKVESYFEEDFGENEEEQAIHLIKNIAKPVALIYGVSGSFNENCVLIPGSVRSIVFGRVHGDVKIPDPQISNMHFKLRISDSIEGYKILLINAGSINGTFVNNELVENGVRQLFNGDIITIGETEMKILILS